METTCLEAWQAIDLVNVQLALDEQAAQVADYRETCMASRKELATKTKSFKKREDVRQSTSEVLKTELPKLLRAYQEEVDRLTQRSKFAENCFLSMYRLIREAPDPSQALSDASKLSYDAEMAIGDAERQVKEKQSMIEELETELQAVAEERDKLANDVKAMQSEGAGNTALDLVELRETLEQEIDQKYQDQMEEYRSKMEDDLTSVTMQLELAQAEIERQQEQIRSLEQQHQQNHPNSGNDRGQINDIRSSISMMEQNNRFEEESQSLLRDLQASREDQANLHARIESMERREKEMEAEFQSELDKLKTLLDDKTERLAEANKKLSTSASKEDYDKLRMQLMVIQKELYNVEFGDNEDDEAVKDKMEKEQLDGLEAWFINSTRQLKKELMVAKRTISEQAEEIKKLRNTELQLSDALKDQSALAEKLERDLALGTSAPGTFQPSDLNPIISNLGTPKKSPGSNSQQSSGEAVHDQQQHQALNSMLQAVCAQRDRLRAQVQASEENFESQRVKLMETEQKLRRLQEDNVQLYQRIRFLQNYKVSERSTLITGDIEQQSDGGSSAVVLSAQGNARIGGLGRGVEHKYRNIYESDMNPLKAFQKQEDERLYRNMSQIERCSITVFNAFLARSRGRVFLAAYSVFLHVVMIYCVLF